MQAARKLEPTEKPKTQKFSLRTPYMKQARTRFTVISMKTIRSSCSKGK